MSIRTLEKIHGQRQRLSARPVDDLLTARIRTKIIPGIDAEEKSFAYYFVKANGTGRSLWYGKRPPTNQHVVTADFTRFLDRSLAPHTGGAWLCALSTWNPAAAPAPRYEVVHVLWKDGDGDIPLDAQVADMDAYPEIFWALREAWVSQAFQAWIEYAEMMEAMAIQPSQTKQFARGERSTTPRAA